MRESGGGGGCEANLSCSSGLSRILSNDLNLGSLLILSGQSAKLYLCVYVMV